MYTPEQLSEALNICMEFGPERAVPPVKRVSARFPELPRIAINQIVRMHEDLIERATEMGEHVRDHKLTFDQAAERLGASFPNLPEEVVRRALNQGCWFASK